MRTVISPRVNFDAPLLQDTCNKGYRRLRNPAISGWTPVNEKEYTVDFILYTINSTYFRKNAERHSTGTTRLRIGLTVLKKLPMAIPPLKEQKKIAGILSMIYNELEKESNHKEQLQLLKKGLMQVLLTGKLRVAV